MKSGRLQHATTYNNNSSLFYTLYTSLWQALSLFGQPCLHQFSGNGFQRQLRTILWIAEVSPCLSHSNYKLTKSQQQHSADDSFHTLSLYAIKGDCFLQTELLSNKSCQLEPLGTDRKKSPSLSGLTLLQLSLLQRLPSNLAVFQLAQSSLNITRYI